MKTPSKSMFLKIFYQIFIVIKFFKFKRIDSLEYQRIDLKTKKKATKPLILKRKDQKFVMKKLGPLLKKLKKQVMKKKEQQQIIKKKMMMKEKETKPIIMKKKQVIKKKQHRQKMTKRQILKKGKRVIVKDKIPIFHR